MFSMVIFACSSSKDSGGLVSDTNDTSPQGCLARTPSIEIGTGEQIFEPLSEGAPVTMVHGPQGGWHLLGSLRFTNLKQIVEIDFTVYDGQSGVVIVENTYRAAMLLDGDCSGDYVGMYGYINVSGLENGELDTPPELLADNPLVMSFNVTDCSDTMEANGECTPETRYAFEELMVTAALDPIDMPDTTDTSVE
jgi:hypothetical protein